jgi:rubrerythrin
MKSPGAVQAVLWIAIATLGPATVSLHAEEGGTLAAMQVAYSMERNAQARYLAFATRAEYEGEAAMACLFEAAARAESVHASNHAIVITQFEATPRYAPQEFVVLGTAENLAAAIVNEQRECDVVYPRLAGYARSECMYEALASCNYARGAEATHERVFRAALAMLERKPAVERGFITVSFAPSAPALRNGPAMRCFVCLGDGSLFTEPQRRCPNCGTGGRRIVEQGCRR